MRLPMLIHDQDELLTLNSYDHRVSLYAIMPGIDAERLVLDPTTGAWVLGVIVHPCVALATHYHAGTVHLLTESGRDRTFKLGSERTFECRRYVQSLAEPREERVGWAS